MKTLFGVILEKFTYINKIDLISLLEVLYCTLEERTYTKLLD